MGSTNGKTRPFFAYTYGVIALGLVIEAIAGSFEAVKGYDLRFDELNAKQKGRRLDVEKAHAQAVIVPRLGAPLGAIALACMAQHLRSKLDSKQYVTIAALWFLSAPLRRWWQVNVSMQLDNRLVDEGVNAEYAYDHNLSALDVTKQYYRRGFELPEKAAAMVKSGLFADRLSFLNKFSAVWYYARYLRITAPFFAEAAASVFWPIDMAVMAPVHSVQAAELKGSRKPWWRLKKQDDVVTINQPTQAIPAS